MGAESKKGSLTADGLSVGGGGASHGEVTLVHGVAVAARAVQLAKVLDGEVGDLEGATTVVLQDLVLGAVGTAALDVGGVAGVLVLDGEGVLADGAPPDVLEGAATLAVDTLDLVGADDDVAQRAALLDLEDGVRVATLSLTGAVDATVVDVHATIEGLASGDGLDIGQGGGAGGGGDIEAPLDVAGLGGRGGRRLRGGDGTNGQGSDENGELHFDCWVVWYEVSVLAVSWL